ncbi:NlpC/P60 family protein [Rhodococcus ruber]|uniref:NlpC/P60 family protein n=3 Tax=Rhodococcus TaxID=1827 RepID=A0A098BRM5_9NOCA|nr:bifunctional lytic transglycosylase/C40 family peptidase [Rhodococcus ruber]MCD2126887.1 NlpC/P60 family protein [Rhodococcus ruber]MCZ4503766.1 NlpC/P60 family protein [Rhodococcus ruber]MCZ4529607.1 NlpC/P60 family protein [Rhodococcus ruber]MCZ4619309.1 NlpC/P60 family protein [Rhodococcus ruber]MDI9968154.1 NlpC/P60 family protein [Rhodococcus ruber]
MSVDPSAVIVAVATAASALVQGVDIPEHLEEQVAQVIESFQASAESSAAATDQQVTDLVAALPEPMRPAAEQAVADATSAAKDALMPHLPPEAVAVLEPPAENPVQAAPPQAPSVLAPAAPAGRPSVFGAPAPGAATGSGAWGSAPGGVGTGGAAVTLPSIPAILPGTNLAPIGAIAVFAPWLRKAGKLCEGVGAPVLAALYSAENGFRYGPSAPVSPVGAKGPGQFMPGTWDAYGKDADGDGRADVLGIADPVMASGNLLCDNYRQIEQWKAQGVVRGDTLDLTLAAYNAGLGAVRRSGGMPSGLPDYENQTKPYVAKIRATEMVFARLLSPFFGLGLPGMTETGNRVVDLAFRYLGLPYVWGGGNINGPSGGGFDCSGLTSYAVYAATGVTLPRTSQTQWRVGTEIPIELARPGDLVFGNWQSDGPGHVGIYIGGGQMVHAPTFGDVVRVGAVFPGMKARRLI